MTSRPSPAPSYVGLRLYRERTRRGWSLYQAGDASGVAHTTVSVAEQGRDIRLSTLLALAGAYGLSLDALTAEPGCGRCLDWGPCGECGRGGVNGKTISDDKETTMTTETTQERDAARAAYERVCEERDGLRNALGSLYRERAHLTAFLAACYPSAQCPDRDDDEYRLLYVTPPDGQMSWHVRTDDADELLGHVPQDETAEWDGHTTEEKYRRLEALVRTLSYLGPPAQVDAGAAERKRYEARAELARVQSAAQHLGRLVTGMARSMEAARIEMLQNGPEEAMEWILNSIPDVDDNDPEDQWNGTESAREWFDRTREAAS